MQKLAILVTKLSSWVLSKMGRGGSMPGRLGIKIAPDCLNHLKFGGPVILVTGTNGKTSTANMVSDLMEERRNVPRFSLLESDVDTFQDRFWL